MPVLTLYMSSFNVRKLYFLPKKCICVFCTDLRKKRYCLPTERQLIGFYNRDGVCFLCGTTRIFKIYLRLFLIFKRSMPVSLSSVILNRKSFASLRYCYQQIHLKLYLTLCHLSQIVSSFKLDLSAYFEVLCTEFFASYTRNLSRVFFYLLER
jgi:hypothetical protein